MKLVHAIARRVGHGIPLAVALFGGYGFAFADFGRFFVELTLAGLGKHARLLARPTKAPQGGIK